MPEYAVIIQESARSFKCKCCGFDLSNPSGYEAPRPVYSRSPQDAMYECVDCGSLLGKDDIVSKSFAGPACGKCGGKIVLATH